jgi:polysaccharide deacetylase 2 family uncharacterized protein YibQ
MAGKGGQRRGLGFVAGVITGLVFSAAVLVVLSLSVPLAPGTPAPDDIVARQAERPVSEPEIEAADAAPSSETVREAGDDSLDAEADDAPPTQTRQMAADDDGPSPSPTEDTDPAVTDSAATSAQTSPGSGTTEADPSVAAGPDAPDGATVTEALPSAGGMAPATGETTQEAVGDDAPPVDGARSVAEAVETPPLEPPAEAVPADPAPEAAPVDPAAATAPGGSAEELASVEPAEAPAPAADAAEDVGAPPPGATDAPTQPATRAPAWRANAATADLVADEPVMTVIVTGARPGTLPALTTLAPLSAVTVALDAGLEDKAGLATALRALGHEVLETVPADAPALSVPLTVGLAVPGVADSTAAAAVLAAVADSGALAVDLLRGAASPLVEAGRAERQPVAGAALRIAAGQTATAAFQTLRDAGALAAQEGTLIVALEASPATLTALGRWLALPGDVQPAPLTALIGRLGDTRY